MIEVRKNQFLITFGFELDWVALAFFFLVHLLQLTLDDTNFNNKMIQFRIPRNVQPVISAKMPKLPPKFANLSQTECLNSTKCILGA